LEEYIRSFRDVKNKLASLGTPIPSSILAQGMLNGLPPTYDSLIQSIGQAAILPMFEQLGTKLLVEFNRLKARAIQTGDDRSTVEDQSSRQRKSINSWVSSFKYNSFKLQKDRAWWIIQTTLRKKGAGIRRTANVLIRLW
jgi:hypothetical protein